MAVVHLRRKAEIRTRRSPLGIYREIHVRWLVVHPAQRQGGIHRTVGHHRDLGIPLPNRIIVAFEECKLQLYFSHRDIVHPGLQPPPLNGGSANNGSIQLISGNLYPSPADDRLGSAVRRFPKPLGDLQIQEDGAGLRTRSGRSFRIALGHPERSGQKQKNGKKAFVA